MNKDLRMLFKNLSLIMILVAVMYVVPKIIGLSREGFDVSEVLTQYNTYISFGIAAAVILIILAVLQAIKQNKTYGSSIFMANQGDFPSFKFWKRYTTVQLFLLSMIFFSILGLVSFSIKQQSFTGVGLLKQQFTVIDSIIFSSALVPIAENLDSIALLALALFILQLIADKANLSKDEFRGFAMSLCITIGIYGIANHLLRYPDQDVFLIIVGIFWTVGAFITIAIGNFVVFLNMHFVNNVLYDLVRYFAVDAIKIYFGTFILTMSIGYAWWYGQVKKQTLFGLIGDKSRLTRDERLGGIE